MTTTLTDTTTPAPATVLDDETRRVLARAKGIVANGWCQGRAADGFGNYCVVGAIRVAAGTTAFYENSSSRAAHLSLNDLLGHQVSRWNDVPGRTQAEVVALFDKALGA